MQTRIFVSRSRMSAASWLTHVPRQRFPPAFSLFPFCSRHGLATSSQDVLSVGSRSLSLDAELTEILGAAGGL